MNIHSCNLLIPTLFRVNETNIFRLQAQQLGLFADVCVHTFYL